MKGNTIDKTIEMNADFLNESIDYFLKNFDQILMMTVIIFLVMSWTWIFEWKFPKKRNLLLRKNIGIEVTEWTEKGSKGGYLVDEYGRKLDSLGNLLENFKSKDEMLNDELTKDCGNDKLCQDHNLCSKTTETCNTSLNCCQIKNKNGLKCVGGNKNGPTYDIKEVDEWWYLGNNYKKN